jgi:hypothetical protein
LEIRSDDPLADGNDKSINSNDRTAGFAGTRPDRRSLTMRDLTFHELDEQLAEQLPSRELMGSSGCRQSYCSHSSGFTYNQGNGNGNGDGNGSWGLINGSGDGNLNGNNVVVVL